ncbi:WhiB family transcriptional regulator [Streptomyces mutabilis]|jgi:WhiB family transcriptional regulator, redox-sensing transcriptional regulator|uniref:WhiB family transcriptional regulator n=1 Tax=Streptomyces TaxID=1883 RepID=UPI000A216F32|nr:MULTISPECIES: WhiB family transcriptional regulator [unclassified Streptomyces]MDG9689870.1 WhiB family transcriptional regulator [Streptomyces sp. DH17]OSC56889.1 transcription factor WhiB [Streptomyces sp. 4F]MDN3248391.1 WhiB family transcriptional regulator [Streptomyces sp. ZSW22]MDN3254527.1 WhiB family transcriptional regulator [Streptomyces sp. MA25(2023)]MDQ0389525.1 WhiB family redox-sensing transcriptional regulator [Streptomyces sp. DSM 42143]
MDNWREHAECRTEDPDLFFPIGTTGPAALQTEQAKAVCRRCPVREQCLRWALDTGQSIGVWGGTSEMERRALKRREAVRRKSG